MRRLLFGRRSSNTGTHMFELGLAAERFEAVVEVPDDAWVLDCYDSAPGNAVHFGYAVRHCSERVEVY